MGGETPLPPTRNLAATAPRLAPSSLRKRFPDNVIAWWDWDRQTLEEHFEALCDLDVLLGGYGGGPPLSPHRSGTETTTSSGSGADSA